MQKGFPWWLSDKESTCIVGDSGNTVRSLDLKYPLEKEIAPMFLAGKSHEFPGGAWQATAHRIAKESNMTVWLNHHHHWMQIWPLISMKTWVNLSSYEIRFIYLKQKCNSFVISSNYNKLLYILRLFCF